MECSSKKPPNCRNPEVLWQGTEPLSSSFQLILKKEKISWNGFPTP